jgi:uncharacterized protein (DUF58 family)
VKGAKEHVEASRRLVALTERETAETQAHIAESKRLMAESHKLLKRPRDPIALAMLIGDIATGQVEDKVEDKRDPAAVAMGQKGGKGAGKMTPERRAEIARKAAAKRWGKTD